MSKALLQPFPTCSVNFTKDYSVLRLFAGTYLRIENPVHQQHVFLNIRR